MNSDKDKIISGIVWKFAERISSQSISFVLSIILARLLMPSEFGIVAMMNIFITFANVFVTSGFNSSLVQKKNADALDFSTIFYCTLSVSLVLYVIIFLTAPLISDFYDMPELTLLIRVFALSLIINSYQSIQQAYVARKMIFRKNFYATFSGTALSGLIGLIMAYKGFGVWALVVQQISNILINTLTLSYIVAWKPQWMFSWNRAKSLMNYGSKILASSFVNTLYMEIRQLLIGLFYTPADLAFYNRGIHLPQLVTNNLDNTLRSVLFPAMSNHSDDLGRVKQMLKRAIKNTSYITYFFLTLMAVASPPLVKVLLTEKWLECVPYMQIFCISLMIQTISVLNLQALKAIGKSHELLKLELFKKPVFLLAILMALPFGVKAIVFTAPINALYALYMNIAPTLRHLGYGRKEQIKDLVPGFLLATIMAIATFPLTLLPFNEFVVMGLQIIVAIIIYVGCSIFFKIEAYFYTKAIIVEIYNKLKKNAL